jgi:hypothetical protein
MTAIVLAAVAATGIGGVSAWIGLKIAQAARERFDALLPQRMVDYCGFVPAEIARD